MILEIVSPEATLFSGEVTSVSVPGINGEFQMLNNHAAVVSILQKGGIATLFLLSKGNYSIRSSISNEFLSWSSVWAEPKFTFK